MKKSGLTKKRVLIIHNRGYFQSGPERFILNFMELFHDSHIDLFCMEYQQNNIRSCLSGLPKPLTTSQEYSLKEQQLSLGNKAKLFFKTLYNQEAYRLLAKHLKSNKYDQILVCQFQFKLTPSIFIAISKFAKDSQLFLRSSDYFLSCVRNTFTDSENQICTKCNEDRWYSVKKRCSGSFIQSLHRALGNLLMHRILHSSKPTLLFTNEFALKMSEKNIYLKGLDKKLLITCDSSERTKSEQLIPNKDKKYDFIFFGRVSLDKGFGQLYSLFSSNTFTLVIVGNVDDDCKAELDQLLSTGRVTHIPFLEKSELLKLINQSRFSLIFSYWFDNLPNSLIESYSQGVPVICYDMGSFAEFIPSDFTSFYKTNYSNEDLREFMELDYIALQQSVLKIHMDKFSPNNFVQSFISI